MSAAPVLTKEKLTAYVTRTVESAPELSQEQLDRIAVIMRGGEVQRTARVIPLSAEREAVKRATEALDSANSKMREALTGCSGCGIPERAHHFQSGVGLGYHAYEPMNAEQIVQTAQLHKRKICRLEKGLTTAQEALANG